jgi:hypothetical protein
MSLIKIFFSIPDFLSVIITLIIEFKFILNAISIIGTPPAVTLSKINSLRYYEKFEFVKS